MVNQSGIYTAKVFLSCNNILLWQEQGTLIFPNILEKSKGKNLVFPFHFKVSIFSDIWKAAGILAKKKKMWVWVMIQYYHRKLSKPDGDQFCIMSVRS